MDVNYYNMSFLLYSTVLRFTFYISCPTLNYRRESSFAQSWFCNFLLVYTQFCIIIWGSSWTALCSISLLLARPLMALNITWRLLLLLWHYTFLQSSDFNLRYLPLAELGVWHCAFLYCLDCSLCSFLTQLFGWQYYFFKYPTFHFWFYSWAALCFVSGPVL